MIVIGVALAAAIGAVIRAVVTGMEAPFERQLLGTAAVNIIGSFVLGLLASSESTTANTLAIVGVGGLGALTTFSTYVAHVERLAREGKAQKAIVYGAGSLVGGILAAYLGWVL